MKNWNKKQASVLYDEKFVKLMLVDVFKTESLAKSTLNTLDQDKIRFIRGVYALIEESNPIFIDPISFSCVDIFNLRCRSNVARASRFNAIVNTYCDNMRKKKNKKQ